MYTIIIEDQNIHLPSLTLDQLQASTLIICNGKNLCYPRSDDPIDIEKAVIFHCLALFWITFYDVKFDDNTFTLGRLMEGASEKNVQF